MGKLVTTVKWGICRNAPAGLMAMDAFDSFDPYDSFD